MKPEVYSDLSNAIKKVYKPELFNELQELIEFNYSTHAFESMMWWCFNTAIDQGLIKNLNAVQDETLIWTALKSIGKELGIYDYVSIF